MESKTDNFPLAWNYAGISHASFLIRHTKPQKGKREMRAAGIEPTFPRARDLPPNRYTTLSSWKMMKNFNTYSNVLGMPLKNWVKKSAKYVALSF